MRRMTLLAVGAVTTSGRHCWLSRWRRGGAKLLPNWNDRTGITVNGIRNPTIIVNDDSGKRVYVPPETSDDTAEGPYRRVDSGSGGSPYGGIQDHSPYDSTRTTETSNQKII